MRIRTLEMGVGLFLLAGLLALLLLSLRVSGLTVGNRLRVFAADGKVEYSATVTADSQLVCLQQHGVYLVSTGEEIFKYNY